MVHNNKEVLEHWNNDQVASMYDKFLLNAEIELIKSCIPTASKILDAGCGEGEGTLEYSKIDNVVIDAVDFSETRLLKAKIINEKNENTSFKKVDFLSEYQLDNDYDVIISQRFLINLMEWELQKKVITDLMSHLKPNGLFLMLEGSQDGVDELNNFRSTFGLPEIPVLWHNLFFENSKMEGLINEMGYKIVRELGLGEYFFLTRGLRPIFDKELNWNVDFNEISASNKVKDLLTYNTKFSRLKLWVISK